MSAQDWARSRKASNNSRSIDANGIPIASIVAFFGGEVRQGRNLSVKCVLHKDSRRSAVMDTDKNIYFCHTCGKGGNAANLVCIIENLEFKDGLKRAVEIAAGSGAAIRPSNNSANSSRAKRTWDL